MCRIYNICEITIAIIFIIISNIAIAENGSATQNSMFFFGTHAGSHGLVNSLAREEADTSADSDTDATESTGLSKNTKIAIGVAAGALALGGIIAAIAAAGGGNGAPTPPGTVNVDVSVGGELPSDATVNVTLSGPSTCTLDNIQPGQTKACDIKPGTYTITGSNYQIISSKTYVFPTETKDINASTSITLNYIEDQDILTAEPAFIAAPTNITAKHSVQADISSIPLNHPLKLINNTDNPITVNNIEIKGLDKTIFNVHQADISNTCKPIAAHGSCQVAFYGTQNAYGDGELAVSYTTTYGTAKTITAGIGVARVTVELSGENVTNNEIILNPDDIHTQPSVTVKNTGFFTLQNINFTGDVPNGVETTNNCAGPLIPGAQCIINFNITDSVTAGDSRILSIHGDNLTPDPVELAVSILGLVITPDPEPQYQHLQYRAIKLENFSDKSYQLTNTTLLINREDMLEICTDTDHNCPPNFTTDCNNPLQKEEYCRVWIHIKQTPNEPFFSNYFGTLQIEINNSLIKKDFIINYANSLYAAGNFTGGIDKYNDEDGWGDPSLANIVGAPYALEVDSNGDLIAGGEITGAGGINVNNLAKWNGAQWSPLFQSNIPSAPVRALAADQNGNLYIGGEFGYFGSQPIFHIIKWDGTTWHTLGTCPDCGTDDPIYALTVNLSSGNLYVGGDFTHAGGAAHANIAEWNGNNWTDETFSSPWPLNSPVKALAVDQNGNVYAGGDFYSAGGGLSPYLNHIAKWNKSNAVWEDLETGLDANVSALAISGDKLIAGGAFTQVVSVSESQYTPLKHIGEYDIPSNIWTPLYYSPETDLPGPVTAIAINRYNGDNINISAIYAAAIDALGTPHIFSWDYITDSGWLDIPLNPNSTIDSIDTLKVIPSITGIIAGTTLKNQQNTSRVH